MANAFSHVGLQNKVARCWEPTEYKKRLQNIVKSVVFILVFPR